LNYLHQLPRDTVVVLPLEASEETMSCYLSQKKSGTSDEIQEHFYAGDQYEHFCCTLKI